MEPKPKAAASARPQPGPLKKVGSNKLVARASSHPNKARFSKGPPGPFHHGKKHQKRYHDGPVGRKMVAKRIKMSMQPSEEDDAIGSNSATVNALASPGESRHSESQGGKLTDYAYHETSRVVQRNKNRMWRKESGTIAKGKRNMGLVRVQPRGAATVCPTFLRGVECTDAFCRKRHDVPKEFAMPICSFFQRQGQCLKEDCKFRHVKVNSHALVCPSFALLGFCEDDSCTMKHVRNQQPGTQRPAHKSVNRTYRRS